MAILDLSKVSSNTFLPEGESVCRVTKVEDKASKDKGTPMVVVTLADRLGRSEQQHFVLSDKALFRIKGFALACGIPEASMARFDTRSLAGCSVLVIKTKKGMRMITTEAGPKEVPDYDFQFGKADGAQPAAAAPGASVPADDIPFAEWELP